MSRIKIDPASSLLSEVLVVILERETGLHEVGMIDTEWLAHRERVKVAFARALAKARKP